MNGPAAPLEQVETGVSCPHDYPFFHDGRCWPTHTFDNLGLYGPSVEPIVDDAVKDLPWHVAGGRWWKVDHTSEGEEDAA